MIPHISPQAYIRKMHLQCLMFDSGHIYHLLLTAAKGTTIMYMLCHDIMDSCVYVRKCQYCVNLYLVSNTHFSGPVYYLYLSVDLATMIKRKQVTLVNMLYSAWYANGISAGLFTNIPLIHIMFDLRCILCIPEVGFHTCRIILLCDSLENCPHQQPITKSKHLFNQPCDPSMDS